MNAAVHKLRSKPFTPGATAMLSTAMRALRADPPHVDTIRRADASIAAARVKLERARAERARYNEARDAAATLAQSAHDEAQRLAGAAAVGEGDAAQAKEAQVNADAADRRAAAVNTTIAGLDGIEAAAQGAIAAAEADRQEAQRAAFAELATAVGDEYRAAALAFVAAYRRCRAVETLAKQAGASITIVRAPVRGFEVPALTGAPRDGDPRPTGFYNDAYFSETSDASYVAEAVEAERERLAAAGIL